MLIVVYHAIGDTGSPVLVTEPQLTADLSRLRDEGYTFVTLDDCAEWVEGRRALPERSVAVTFDDGYQSIARRGVRIFARFAVPVTVYCIAGRAGLDNLWPGQWKGVPRLPLASPEELRAMADAGIIIGAHSMTHPVLTTCDAESLGREIDDCADLLENIVQRPVRHFAYPYGIRGSREIAGAARRYRTAVSAHPAVVERRTPLHDLPRLDCHDLRGALALGLHTRAALRPYLATRRVVRRMRRRLESLARSAK